MTTRFCSSSALTFDNKAQSSSCSPPRSSPPELLILLASQHSPFLLCLPMPHWGGSLSPDHTHPIVCLPRTFGRAINPLMAATYRSHNHQGRDDNLFVQNHLCRFSVDSHFTPNRGLLCGRGALAVPRLYLLLCHFMPASPPLPAKEHYFLSHSKDCHYSLISYKKSFVSSLDVSAKDSVDDLL